MKDFSDFENLMCSDSFKEGRKAAAKEATSGVDVKKLDLNARLALFHEGVGAELAYTLRAYHEWLNG